MDKSSIIGIILGVAAIGTGMVLKGVSPAVLVNPAALLIILAGTAATVIIGFPMSELKKIPKLLKIIFTEQQLMSTEEMIHFFSDWAQTARREGLLALEARLDEVDDAFFEKRPEPCD